MNFDTEYALEQFREIQDQYFDKDGKLWGGLHCANLSGIMTQMLALINRLEIEMIKVELDKKCEAKSNEFADAFPELVKAKDGLFDAITEICKDYNKTIK